MVCVLGCNSYAIMRLVLLTTKLTAEEARVNVTERDFVPIAKYTWSLRMVVKLGSVLKKTSWGSLRKMLFYLKKDSKKDTIWWCPYSNAFQFNEFFYFDLFISRFLFSRFSGNIFSPRKTSLKLLWRIQIRTQASFWNIAGNS